MDEKLIKLEDVTTIARDYNGKLKGKVDQVPGKGLSSNDFSQDYISRIETIEAELEGLPALLEEVI